MVIGPVAVQSNLPRPPFSKEVKNKLPVQENVGNFDVPNKQPLPGYPDYGNLLPPPPNKSLTSLSLKYPELYSVPLSSKYPELCSSPGQYDLPLFPVDTPNTIPNVPINFKQESHSEQEQPTDKAINSSNFDFLSFGEADFSLSSLLTLSTPANKEVETSNSIGDVPLDLFDLQPMDDLDMLNPLPNDSQLLDGIHYWHGLHKDSKVDMVAKEPQATVHPYPFTYNFPSVEPKKSQESSVVDVPMTYDSPMPYDNTLLSGKFEALSEASPASSVSSPMIEDAPLVHSNTPGNTEKWQQDLFEKTFNLSDIAGEFMLPPPNKRQEESPSSVYYWPLDHKPQVVPLISPKQEEESSPPVASMECTQSPIPEKVPEERGKMLKNKSKPTLLFGKDEGEIIGKLLGPKQGVRSKPITRDKLVSIPVEEFNQLLEQAQLTEIEVAFMKEWRRRGKNKAAAQIARKRKREEVSDLDQEVQAMHQQKDELQKEYDRLRSLIESLKERCTTAEDKLFQRYNESVLEPVSRTTHRIHIVDDDQLLLIPRVSSKTHNN